MNVFFGLLSLAGLSLFLARVLRRSSALMPVLAVSIAMLFFTLAGVLGLLQAAGWAWYALCAAALIYTLVREKGAIAKRFTPGLWFFVLGGAFFILLFNFTRPMLTLWDEFTFWGTAAKVTSGTGELYTVARSSLIARTYPPGLILHSYMMQFFGGFSEAGFIASFAVFYLACFSAVSAALDGQKSAAVLLLLSMAGLPLLFERHTGQMMYAYLSCMADLPMGLLMGAALCFYFGGEEKDARLMLPFGVILAALTNVKDMGLALALVALVVVALDMLFCERERLQLFKLKGWAAWAVSLLYGLIMIAGAYLLWWAHLKSLPQAVDRFDVGAGGQSMGQLTMLVTGVKMLLGIDPSAQFTQVKTDMLSALFTRPVSLLGPGVAVLVVIWAISALAVVFSATRRQTRRVVVFSFAMLLGFVAFYVFNIFTYALVFKPAEAEMLREYERYISPFWMAWLMGAVLMLARAASYHKASFYRLRMARAATGVVAAGLIAVVLLRGNPQANFISVSPSLFTQRQNLRGVATAARDEGMRPEDDVYIISQGDDGTRFYMFGFELEAVRTLVYNGVAKDEMGEPVLDENGNLQVYGNAAVTLARPGDEHHGPFDLECTPEELAAFFKQEGNTHVLVDVVDDYILEDMSEMFSDGLEGWGELTRGHTYYRIQWDDEGGCTLVPQEGGAA